MKTLGGHKFMFICSTNSSVGRHKLDNLMSFMLHELVGISFALCFVSTLIHFVFVQLLHQSIPNTFPCKLFPDGEEQEMYITNMNMNYTCQFCLKISCFKIHGIISI